eukprot:3934560-Rhodomonas_salina.1
MSGTAIAYGDAMRGAELAYPGRRRARFGCRRWWSLQRVPRARTTGRTSSRATRSVSPETVSSQ